MNRAKTASIFTVKIFRNIINVMHANQIEEVFRTRENYCIRDIAVVTMAALLLQISTMSGVIKIFLSGG